MRITFLLPCMLAALISFPVLAEDDEPGKVIAGWVEKVTVPEIRDEPIKAKLDTGAKTSSMHAIDIEEFEHEGEDWVRFTFEDKDGSRKELKQIQHRNAKIKDLDGGVDNRPVVLMDVCFDGRLHEVQFTLNDRTGFNYRILLGRRFLKDVAVIDSDEVFLTKERCHEAEQDD